jgi:hypothetical protein
MISAADLQLWGIAGLPVPDEPVVEPEPPNFRGDILKFTRRDKDGVVRTGYMHRDHIVAAQQAGEDITIEDDDHQGLPVESNAAFTPVDQLTALRAAITQALNTSDHYFLADRADVGDEKRAAWAAYRKQLRAARAFANEETIIAALPSADPKGIDAFASFRTPMES